MAQRHWGAWRQRATPQTRHKVHFTRLGPIAAAARCSLEVRPDAMTGWPVLPPRPSPRSDWWAPTRRTARVPTRAQPIDLAGARRFADTLARVTRTPAGDLASEPTHRWRRTTKKGDEQLWQQTMRD